MNRYLIHFRIYIWSGIIFYSLFSIFRHSILTAYGIEISELVHISLLTSIKITTFGIVITSFTIALLLSFIDILLIKKLLYRKSLVWVFTVGVVVEATTLFLSLGLLFQFFRLAFERIPNAEFRSLTSIEVGLLIATIILHIIFARFVIEVDQKLGPGNLFKMLMGRFYVPKEEERIFMFIDLKNSTAIAEKLGHRKYSLLLQDCFRDLSVVRQHGASVYQYVGDEVVLTWLVRDSKNYSRFLNAYFLFQNTLKGKENYYRKQYGVFPVFKAGAHCGPVIATEVGEIKREITFHGDTINTASRIQGMCNEFEVNMLISEKLHSESSAFYSYTFEPVGAQLLRGKMERVSVFKVSE